MKVRKAVIPAAGLGTRFLPGTKALAKEMFPIIDKPTIQFIIEEAKKSGIEDILVVTGKGKRPIEDHFDSVPELEQNLKEKGKTDLLRLVQQTTDINLYFIRQSHPRGLGDAVLMAKDFVGNEPFVVMLGDDVMEDKVPLTKQLINRYEETHASTLAVMKVPHEEVNKYGVIDPTAETKPGLYDVKQFVEKPAVEEAPSDLAIIGRYLLTPEIFGMLETQEPGAGNVLLAGGVEALDGGAVVRAVDPVVVGAEAEVAQLGLLLEQVERREHDAGVDAVADLVGDDGHARSRHTARKGPVAAR